ncbi:hypothetical protein Efla_007867 [Eimeria flavescens]
MQTVQKPPKFVFLLFFLVFSQSPPLQVVGSGRSIDSSPHCGIFLTSLGMRQDAPAGRQQSVEVELYAAPPLHENLSKDNECDYSLSARKRCVNTSRLRVLPGLLLFAAVAGLLVPLFLCYPKQANKASGLHAGADRRRLAEGSGDEASHGSDGERDTPSPDFLDMCLQLGEWKASDTQPGDPRASPTIIEQFFSGLEANCSGGFPTSASPGVSTPQQQQQLQQEQQQQPQQQLQLEQQLQQQQQQQLQLQQQQQQQLQLQQQQQQQLQLQQQQQQRLQLEQQQQWQQQQQLQLQQQQQQQLQLQQQQQQRLQLEQQQQWQQLQQQQQLVLLQQKLEQLEQQQLQQLQLLEQQKQYLQLEQQLQQRQLQKMQQHPLQHQHHLQQVGQQLQQVEQQLQQLEQQQLQLQQQLQQLKQEQQQVLLQLQQLQQQHQQPQQQPLAVGFVAFQDPASTDAAAGTGGAAVSALADLSAASSHPSSSRASTSTAGVSAQLPLTGFLKHPFVRYPRLRPGVKCREFCESMLSFPRIQARQHAPALHRMRALLVEEELDQQQAEELLLLSEQLARYCFMHMRNPVGAVQPAHAAEALGRRFLIYHALYCASQTLNQHWQGTPWWRELGAGFSSDYERQRKRYSSTYNVFTAKLALDLLEAIIQLKNGETLDDDVVIDLKRRLFCNKKSPLHLRGPQWNAWRKDGETG